MKGTEKSSTAMAVARIVMGLLFIMFAQYKLIHPDFAHGGYEKTVSGYAQETAVGFYKPFLRTTLKYPVASGYAVGVAELLIGLSMVLGFWVRPFAIVGALFMLNLFFSTWHLPPHTAAWKYLANQLENIPIFLMFLLFYVHNAGETLGLDKSR